MSEVIISRRGGSSGSGGNNETYGLITKYIMSNINWVVPSNATNNSFSIRIFGAGAHNFIMSSGSGRIEPGCSGWMNNGVYTLTPGTKIPITIGRPGTAGGTSSFGTYLSANGGSLTLGGSGSICLGTTPNSSGNAAQFGGGGGNYSSGGVSGYVPNVAGGKGGVWGGGGGGYSVHGGDGGTYGGGGGGGSMTERNNWYIFSVYGTYGGNGGTYGGGGGGGLLNIWQLGIVSNSTLLGYVTSNRSKAKGGTGGTWGGNGGNGGMYLDGTTAYYSSAAGINGTNTSTWTNVTKDDLTGVYFRGWGRRGYNNWSGGGGGGFGGNGGNAVLTIHNWSAGGGGGGYGSNGGNGYAMYGGGGGGYGGDGESIINDNMLHSGGGGGYGKVSVGRGGGGGGYYCPGGGINNTGGGGGIGIWENNVLVASFGSGTGYHWYPNSNNISQNLAEPGICIIQYYK